MTPTPAPALMPTMPGSASSLRVIPWSIAPDNASAMPASRVISIRGRRMVKSTKLSSKVPWPKIVGISRLYETGEEPMPIPMTMVARMSSARPDNTNGCLR
ncbi:hypothetical protein D3C73_1346880 [compost metagenome]